MSHMTRLSSPKTNRRRHEPIIDALPEYYPFRDTGCDVSPSCLKCPLPRCKFDDPGWYLQEQRQQRDQEVLQVRRTQGATVPQLAHRFGLSQRTIHRILSRAVAHPRPGPPSASNNGSPAGMSPSRGEGRPRTQSVVGGRV